MTVRPLDRIQGDVLASGDPAFDEASAIWNARLQQRPERVVRPTAAADVGAAVDVARDEGVALSVKGAGHAYAGRSVREGSILIDLSSMRSIRIDRERRTATIEGGVTCGELDAATAQHGLATPLPTASSVGVCGAMVGGGSGYLSRSFGLTLDNLRSAEVVTADGRAVRASQDENADLFWAIRGGGSNFGVVTQAELALHESGPEVLSGQVIYPLDRAGEMLRAHRDFMAKAPDALQCYPFMFRVPPIDAFPAEWHGQVVLDFVVFHADPAASDVVQPLRELGEPILDAIGPAPYVAVQQAFDANLPAGQRYYSKAHDLAALDDDVIDTVLEHAPDMRGPFTIVYFEPLGGAVGRVADDATAYGARDAAFGFHCLAGWTDAADDAGVMSWASGLHEAMGRHATGGVYVNLLAEDEPDRIPAAYRGTFDRLVELKRKWDPDNLFASNHNIGPRD